MPEDSALDSAQAHPEVWPMLGVWPRALDGYEWTEGKVSSLNEDPDEKDPGPWLIPKSRLGRPYSFLRVRHSILTALVRAGRNPTLQRFLDFANKRGSLGEDEHHIVLPTGNGATGTSLSNWRRHAVRLAMLHELWQHVRSENVEFLAEFVVWGNGGVRLEIPHVSGRLRPDLIGLYGTNPSLAKRELEGIGDTLEWTTLASSADPSTARLLDRWPSGDVLRPATYFVCREVNKALKGKVDRVVLPFWDDGGIRYFPESLLATAYIAFQDLINGRKPERECAHCGLRFTMTRSNQKYCSENCAKRGSDASRRLARREELQEEA